MLFGGRRATAVPLAVEAFDWDHGVYLAANMASEGTPAAEGEVGQLRRDPFAMLPFCRYHLSDCLANWCRIGADAKEADRAFPKIFFVNRFRKGPDGNFLWPGYEENARVLRWVIERVEGGGKALETAIGHLPTPGAIGMSDLGLAPAVAEALLAVDIEIWTEEARRNREYLESLENRVPALARQQFLLEQRLGSP